MDGDNSKGRRRGPYRTKQRVPRQTIYSRRKKLARVISSSNSDSQPEVTAEAARQLIISSNPEYTNCEDATCVENFHEHSLDSTLLAFDSDMDDSVLLATPPTAQQLADIDPEVNSEVSTKLYEGSSLSTEGSRILISSYMCRHHLTGQACEDLLQLLRIHLPKNNQLSSSLYTFHKHTDHTRDVMPDYHYYCHECCSLLPSDDAIQCPNTSCNTIIKKECINFFITVPIADQLKILLSSKHIKCMIYIIAMYDAGQGFCEALTKQVDSHDCGLSDIYHGDVYRTLGLQNEGRNICISLTLNTDGALVYQSRSCSMWPVLLMINELPFNARFIAIFV